MKRTRNISRGFTLVEMLVALSLLSIITGMVYSFYAFAHKQVIGRENKTLEFDNAIILLQTIGNNILHSKATIVLEPLRWVFLNGNADTATYEFVDGNLRFNNLILTMGKQKPYYFSFTGFGIDSVVATGADNVSNFRDLDQNSDGTIEGAEIANLAWIKASIAFKEDLSDSISTRESVKNKLSYDVGKSQTYFSY